MRQEQEKEVILKEWKDYYMYRCVYFEALDLIINCIKNCTVQPGYYVYSRPESLFVNAARKLGTEEDLDFVMKFYKEATGKHQLEVKMDILAANLPLMAERYIYGLPCLLSQSKEMSHA